MGGRSGRFAVNGAGLIQIGAELPGKLHGHVTKPASPSVEQMSVKAFAVAVRNAARE